MNIITPTNTKKTLPGWERPVAGPDATLPNRTAEDIAEWWLLVDQIIEVASANGWNKADVGRRVDMPGGTFSQWFSGKYNGRLANQNRVISSWLSALEEANEMAATVPQSPAFLKTRLASEVLETLTWAQFTADMAIITAGAGMGKTQACRHYCDTHPRTFHTTISPHTRTVHGMLTELCAELDVMVFNPAKFSRAIGARLARGSGHGHNSLLIVDEAQNLYDDSINQLRHFVDIYKCGVVLVGNKEIYGRFSAGKSGKVGASYDQIKRRIGKRLNYDKPLQEDLHAFITEGWGVEEQDMIRFLTGIGLKGGALGQVDKTMKLAQMLALGSEQTLSLNHLQQAWKNRDVEDMA